MDPKFLRLLFAQLKDAGYAWEPVSPERLLEYRRESSGFDPLTKFFGLGLPVKAEELVNEGLTPETAVEAVTLSPAISRVGERLFAHSHWPARHGSTSYVYLGEESYKLIRLLQEHLSRFEGVDVLDLGSGAGVLSIEVSSLAAKVLGIEFSAEAVRMAQANAGSQDISNVDFRCASVGTPEADQAALGRDWKVAIFNPPMAVSTESDARPHRDGGRLGIEIPLLFIDFAARHLKRGGEVFCLATNPIVRGKREFFERLDRRTWEIVEKRCLNEHFNHSLYRKEGYAERDIERVELWFLHLSRL